ncbi:MAG: DUF4384 domain-containing protein [Hyphomicrobiaceae bacterium]|nr:DUF4384 domain-containing protein [Hyphomicrobiaceae bacterium]
MGKIGKIVCRGAARLAALALVGFISTAARSPVIAQNGQLPATPAAAETALAVVPGPAETARAILDKHCARCHQRGRGEPAATQALDYVLDIEQLARANTFVMPGRPDASRLYSVMISGHVPAQVYDAANPGPTAEEIDQVRGWIESLEQQDPPACPERRQVTLADEGRALANLRGPGGAALKGIRFISLAAYQNGCASAGEMEAKRRAVGDLVTGLRTTLVEFDLPLAADDMPILAVRLGDMGWDPSQWDALAAQAGAPQLTDAALVEAYGTETPLIDVRDLASAAMASGHFPALASLGREASKFIRDGTASVDLAKASADIGRVPESLLEQLATVQGATEGYAIALRQGTISGPAWRELRSLLARSGSQGSPLAYSDKAPLHEPARLDVALWTDKLTYQKGDVVALTAQANRDCNLTVINVDTQGEATVLFPSDSDPDNAVKAGAKVRIPSDIEPYLLRANASGTETFIAVCTLNRKRMLGIDQDFEKQRFSMLGNWRTFLKTAATRETLVGRRDTPRQRRARIKAVAAQAATVTAPEQEARTAIYVKIE